MSRMEWKMHMQRIIISLENIHQKKAHIKKKR